MTSLKKRPILSKIKAAKRAEKISPKANKPSSPNKLNKMSLNLRENLGVSHRFITLIDEEDTKSTSRNRAKKIDKPNAIRKINQITQKFRGSYINSIPKLEFDQPSNRQTIGLDGEENMIESPCPRVKLPTIQSYRKSSEKTNASMEFSIVPKLMDGFNSRGTIEINLLEQSSSGSEIFERADTFDDEHYELFTWWREFDFIMNGTHQDIFDKNDNILRPKKVRKEQKKEDPFQKYNSLRANMSRQENKIWNKMISLHAPSELKIDKVASRRNVVKKRNSQANLPIYRDTAPTKSVRSSILFNFVIEIQKS
jgi:hypothetical protein